MSKGKTWDLTSAWVSIAQSNEYPPLHRLEKSSKIRRKELFQKTMHSLVLRLVADLPGRKPQKYFHLDSAEAMAKVIYLGLVCLGDESSVSEELYKELEECIDQFPYPKNPEEYITQGALGWFAFPIAQKMSSPFFLEMNFPHQNPSQEEKRQRFVHFLSLQPLFSLRKDSERFFAFSPVPFLNGFSQSTLLWRWLMQRLISPCSHIQVASRRALILRSIYKMWPQGDIFFREILFLWSQRLGPEPILGDADKKLLAPFLKIFLENQWPSSFAKNLRREALILKQNL